MLRLEDVNLDASGNQRQLWCYAISAKRYVLYSKVERDEPQLVKWSEHGLGHLLNPTDPDSDDRDWMRQVWEWIVREELGLSSVEPPWLDRPAVSRLTISSPELWRPFDELNQPATYGEQVKPFNFMIAAHVRRFGHPVGVDPEHFHLIAPFELDPRKWETVPWIDRYSGKPFRISTDVDLHRPDMALVKSMRDVLAEFQTHPEAKSADRFGRRAGRQTVGLLQRRTVKETFIAHVGKEANKLESIEVGFEHDLDAVRTEYPRTGHDHWTAVVLPLLRQADVRTLASETGMSSRQLRNLVAGKARPHPSNQAKIENWIGRQPLAESGLPC